MDWLNGVLGGAGGAIGLFVVSNLIIAAIRARQLSKAPKKFMLDQGYSHGKWLRPMLKRVFNDAQIVEVVSYASDLPNHYDKGWDAALAGKPKPIID